MNLTNLFNFQYLKENIKKSRAIILLMIFLIPVINVIYYLMNSSNSNYIIPSILELQPLSLLGMYILPVLLSITLFGFTAEEMLEAGAEYEDVMSLGGLVN